MPYYVGPMIEKHGYNMAELVFQVWPDKKANLVAIEGAAGAAQTILMNEAFDEEFAGTEIKFLAKQNADWDSDKALAIMTDYLTTYGDENPIFVEDKSGSVWPEYNITIAQNLFRSANPRTHSFEVDFSVGGILTLGILFGILSISAKNTRRNKK